MWGLFDRLFGKGRAENRRYCKEALENIDCQKRLKKTKRQSRRNCSGRDKARDKVEKPAQEELPQASTEEVIEPRRMRKLLSWARI